MQRVLDSADAVLIGGESFVTEVSERLGTARERFTIVPGAVDTQRFRPAQDAPTTAARVGEATFPVRLLYHGRVDRRKGVLDCLDALALLRARDVPFEAVVSGIGPDLDAAQARSAELGFDEGVVRFTGHADYAAVPEIYRAADIFVSPTYGEGFSNTILEAMASGLATLSCFAVGVKDCLRDGENGLLVEPGDIVGQADRLQSLIQDHALRRRIATDALEECRRVYSWTAVGRTIMGVYARVLRSPRGGHVDPALPRSACRFRAEPHLL